MSLKMLACQIQIPATTRAAQRRAHVARVVELIDAALDETPVDLVVLPELCTIDYSRDAFGALAEIAEPLDGETSRTFGALARRHGVHVVFGMPRSDDGQYLIGQVVMAPDGRRLGHYDKIHIAQYGASMEKEYFVRGERLLTFEVGGYRLAPIICYDIRIPELTRTLCVDHGADIILHCGAYARDESFASWHDFAVTRAMENQVYFLSLSRAGADYGESIFCPPWVDEHHRPVVLAQDETLRVFEADSETIATTRARYPFLSDRLPDYRALPALTP